MEANKVILNGETLIDLTSDTVQADKMFAGYTAHDASGEIITGNVAVYGISVSITDGTSSGAERILDGNIAEVELSADEGYALPSSITVSGADYTYDSSTGKVVLSEPTESVSITVVCEEQQQENLYLTFRETDENSTLSLAGYNDEEGFYGAFWDGTMEYSFDATNWNLWDGNTITAPNKVIYLRGTSNTTCNESSGEYIYKLQINGTGVAVEGNIETLLDYATVGLGNHPPMATSCFSGLFSYQPIISAPSLPATTLAVDCYGSMFSYCSQLETPPSLPATTLATGCYGSMFNNCTSLTTAPSLPATTLATGCYNSMFYGCSSLTQLPSLPALSLYDYSYNYMFDSCSLIELSTTQDGYYTNAYRIPTTGTGEDLSGEGSMDSMFGSTSGTFTGTPSINTTYYTPNEIV